MNTLLVYMPALNEGNSIYTVLKSIPTKIEGFSNIKLLVVNDGSQDNTELEGLRAGAVVLNHQQNAGVGVAFQTALSFALKIKAEVLVSIDADGQFDVSQIKKMIEPIISGQADFCIGNRFEKQKPDRMPLLKYWGNKQINKIVSFVGKVKIKDASCGFRAYSKECILNLNLEGNFTYTHETILDLLSKGFRIKQIPIKVTYFDDRVSRVANNLFIYGLKTSKIIIKCLKDYNPFYFFTGIAFFVFIIASIIGGFVLFHWFTYGVITPYKSLGIISLSLFGMSLLIMTLALIADMIGRIRQNQEKILYLLKKMHYNKNEY